jgi:hypothetical protein
MKSANRDISAPRVIPSEDPGCFASATATPTPAARIVSLAATVIGALRRFLPAFLKTEPPLSESQRRAIWAITHCRTAELGGRVFDCKPCGRFHFAYHSCNHKACPQCGAGATQRWVQRELGKLVNAPYFLVTFTVPSELRGCFFGPLAKEAYDMFFTAVSRALSEKLATAKELRAHVNGFTAALHTWNQCMGCHPHIHCVVPGAGLDAHGKFVRVKKSNRLLHLPHLQAAFRQHFRRLLDEKGWQVDPQVWTKDWGVHIQPAGSGAAALKYLGNYVARTAISDARILQITEESVTFRWKDRDKNRIEETTLPGVEFVRRYLRHVLPAGLRSVRYYGFCHPAAKANRMRVQLHSGRPVQFGFTAPAAKKASPCPACPHCGGPTQLIALILPAYKSRAPPGRRPHRSRGRRRFPRTIPLKAA